MSLLGLDVGTTGCKGVVFNEKGDVLASGYREYSLLYPKENWVELEPVLVWEKVKEVLQEINSRVSNNPVSALAVSSQGETVTAIDRKGNNLYNYILNLLWHNISMAKSEYAEWNVIYIDILNYLSAYSIYNNSLVEILGRWKHNLNK